MRTTKNDSRTTKNDSRTTKNDSRSTLIVDNDEDNNEDNDEDNENDFVVVLNRSPRFRTTTNRFPRWQIEDNDPGQRNDRCPRKIFPDYKRHKLLNFPIVLVMANMDNVLFFVFCK